ncbi:MAG TPA: inorganic diphosphatase [Bdellovibrionales bacterium]|nr:inorganic diphosphatase [Bdellovibrionales bacterium]
MLHPWHEVGYGDRKQGLVNALIEIPRESKTKFELDKVTGLLRVDRVLYSSVHYPANYGFIPQTYCGDKDPLDILVLGQALVPPLSIMRAKPIGYMKMVDQGEEDDKIIAVHADDPEFSYLNSISELAPHKLREIKNFFEIYKNLEGKQVNVEDFHDAEKAWVVIDDAIDLYAKNKTALRSGT